MAFGARKNVLLIACCLLTSSAGGGSLAENYDEFRRAHFCNNSSFRCRSGECIDEEFLCDGTVHCKDGSDETRDCVNIIPCSSSFLFQCDYGACINKAQQCDGKYDCKDKSDESEIACAKCGYGGFQCKSGECIKDENLCDGTGHCRDLSDETVEMCQNLKCPKYSYRCKYGACVSRSARCNGVLDCVDASDEKNCGSYQTHATLPPTISCYRNEFKCDSGECINEKDVCNGRKNCGDGSDETFDLCAFKRCPFNKFRCEYGGCVAMSAKCNNVADCWDASDEKNCSVTISAVQPPTYEADGSRGCAIPKDPDHGKYEISAFEKNGAYSTRSTVPDFSVLVTKCSDGYSPTPPMDSTLSVCFNTAWTPALQECSRACPTILSSTQTQCNYNGKALKTCENPIEGTIALTPCDNASHTLLQICQNGVWNIPISRCLPSISTTNSTGTVINIFYIFRDKSKR